MTATLDPLAPGRRPALSVIGIRTVITFLQNLLATGLAGVLLTATSTALKGSLATSLGLIGTAAAGLDLCNRFAAVLPVTFESILANPEGIVTKTTWSHEFDAMAPSLNTLAAKRRRTLRLGGIGTVIPLLQNVLTNMLAALGTADGLTSTLSGLLVRAIATGRNPSDALSTADLASTALQVRAALPERIATLPAWAHRLLATRATGRTHTVRAFNAHATTHAPSDVAHLALRDLLHAQLNGSLARALVPWQALRVSSAAAAARTDGLDTRLLADFATAALQVRPAIPPRVRALLSRAHRKHAPLTPLPADALGTGSAVATLPAAAPAPDWDAGRRTTLLADLVGCAALKSVMTDPERILAALAETHRLQALLEP